MTPSNPKPMRHVAIFSFIFVAMSTFGVAIAQDQSVIVDETSDAAEARLEALDLRSSNIDEIGFFAAPETDQSFRDGNQQNLEYSLLPNLDLNLGLIESGNDGRDYEFREAWELPGIYLEPLESDLKAQISTSF